MPYKDRVLQREAVKKAVQKHRVLQEGRTKQGITEGRTEYPAIIKALADPVKRAKLRAICGSLGKRGLQRQVYYGYPGLGGVPMDVVYELLEAF